jgi:membrane protein implicated in regulation of membrane protease activity
MSGEWLHWYYLIFLLPAAVAVLVLLLGGLGGTHGHGAHAGGHLQAHHGFGLRLHWGHGHHGAQAGHAPHAAHAAHGAHAQAAAHASHGHAGHAAHGHAGHGHAGHHHAAAHGRAPGVVQQLLGFFGIGRAPIPIVIGSLMIGWGLFGIAALQVLQPILHFPLLFVGPAMIVAAAGALLFAKLFGEIAERLMPKDESYAISREGLVGLTGKVVYAVSDSSGRVHVFDQFRTLHVASARVASGLPPIGKGTEVIVASMDLERGCVIVEPLGFSMKLAGQDKKELSPEQTPVSGEQSLIQVQNGEDPR